MSAARGDCLPTVPPPGNIAQDIHVVMPNGEPGVPLMLQEADVRRINRAFQKHSRLKRIG
jgi:hypothetical protein